MSFETCTPQPCTPVAGGTYTVTANPIGEKADAVLIIKKPDGSIIDTAPIDGKTADDALAGEAPEGAESYIIGNADAGTYLITGIA